MITSLNALRGLALVFVFFGHSMYFFYDVRALKPYYGLVMIGGGWAMEFFLVISGFLIGRRMLSGDPQPVAEFAVGLSVRLLPAYFFALAAVYAIYRPAPDVFWSYPILLQGMGFTDWLAPDAFFPVSWSLGVTFYGLIFIAVIIRYTRLVGANPIHVVAAMMIGLIIMRILVLHLGSHSTTFGRMTTWLRFDPLFAGVLVSAFVTMVTRRMATGLVLAGAAIVMGHYLLAAAHPYIRSTMLYTTAGTLSADVAAAMIAAGLISRYRDGKGLFFSFFAYLSSIAFPFYLVHTVVLEWAWILSHQVLPDTSRQAVLVPGIVFAFVASVAISHLVMRCIERPIIALYKGRRNLTSRRDECIPASAQDLQRI